ncbi:putative ABC transport system permease protein [Reichenbachiella faecimaris]|uniref:Putative ABC transport system permease protein n=1 Tax=Reichenbachiella faecimaris TaxID=692418 RepID=A0A1W2G703_REIFA|nr:ABC transporter permease [Reichenbachiella faecimaris]SMD32086.1 putative ABC transport system permease protein [Reichenbachiella faecimaris]
MNLIENIREAVKSILANKLRTILTAAIIAIGITSLVGILTAIDGIQNSINDSFSNLGSNTFVIEDKREERGKKSGVSQKSYSALTFDEVSQFVDNYNVGEVTALYTTVTRNAEVKYGSEVTNPNFSVLGGDINYLYVEGYDVEEGRSISAFEHQNGSNVVLIGNEVLSTLFKENERAVNKSISFLGSKFKIVGVLAKQGTEGGRADRAVVVPLTVARRLAKNRSLNYRVGVSVKNPTKMDHLMGEATGLMKAIRRDTPGSEDSFDIQEKKSLAERLGEITGYLRIGGFTIGFITLLGASIGLMNIMLVSVTERTREIGVRKAMGATPKRIRQQFLIESIVITQIGGFGGVILGFIVGNVISNLLADTFVVPWLWMLFGFLVGMIVGLLSGYLPAYKASKLDPIVSLRFE